MSAPNERCGARDQERVTRNPQNSRVIPLPRGVRWWVAMASSVGLSLIMLVANTWGAERWNNDRLWGVPDQGPPLTSARYYGGWTWNEPVGMARPPHSDRLFVFERRGQIHSFVDSQSHRDGGEFEPDLFLDVRQISPDTREVYGLAFPPNFPDDPHAYVCYIGKADDDAGTRVSRFRVTWAPHPVADLDSEELLLTFRSGGHNGGCLEFGPDGMLYISTGDAGPASPPDPLKTGQDNSDLLSCILRIDVSGVDAELPYRIPSDNPFVDRVDSRDEIWAYGLRNPWKMSFDPGSGDLWVGDVGWELWEMIDRIEPGGNYGWAVREGYQLIHPDDAVGPTPILPPTMVHSHRESRSITGGYVYTGNRFPELVGHYVYGDYETGKVWSFRFQDGKVFDPRELADTDLKLVSFGLNHDDELLLVDMIGGGLHRLEQRQAESFNAAFPKRLSETGLFRDLERLEPADGVFEYELRADPWMDGAVARRWVALPSPEPVRPLGGGFAFPEGSVLVKTILLPRSDRSMPPRRLETQIQMWVSGSWHGYSYIWNDAQTDAELMGPDGGVLTIPPTEQDSLAVPLKTWTIASRTECTVCHTTFQPQMGVLGFEPLQLDRATRVGGQPREQWGWLQAGGVLPLDMPQPQASLVDPYDDASDLDARARSYLHVNCRHCHRDGGGGGSTMKLAFDLGLDQLDLADWKPQHGDLGLDDARRVAPGNPQRSVLLARVTKTGRGRMPYKGSDIVDRVGVRVLQHWIEELDAATTPELSDAVRQATTEGPSETVNWQAWDPSAALQLALALHGSDVSPLVRTSWSHAALSAPDPSVRDLLLGVSMNAPQRATLRPSDDLEPYLARDGNPVLGEELFRSSVLQCAKCHRIAGTGGELGPDLSTVGRDLTPRQLLESLAEPSRRIAEGYQTELIELTDGGVLTGRVLSRDDQGLRLLTVENQTVFIATSEIERLVPAARSLMPDDLVGNLTGDELVDLLSYLKSLR